MKKILIFGLSLVFTNLLIAQGTVTVTSGQTTVEVGIPYNYSFNFTPQYVTNPISGVTPDTYVITEWIVTTGLNGYGGSIPGYIGSPTNQSSYYYDGTYNNSSTKTVPIQWGNGTFLTYDVITVKVSGIYKKNSTGENTGYFNYVSNTLSISTIQRLTPPIIAGVSSVPDCDQTNTIFSISNFTNGNQYLWTTSSGATIVGSSTGSSATVKPPLTGSYNVFCDVKRSGSNVNYVVSGLKSVTRTPFTSTATISGNKTVCATRAYSVSGLLVGQTVTWSLSN